MIRGLKEITPDNWLEPDLSVTGYVYASSGSPITGKDWLEPILEPQLSEAVPDDIIGMFEVARSAMAYGWFYYPLYSLAEAQLFRVAEAAVTSKCRENKGKSSKSKTFEKKIDYLAQENIIEEKDRSSWHAMRRLRNSSSHPDFQSIQTPPEVIQMLYTIVERINSLWK